MKMTNKIFTISDTDLRDIIKVQKETRSGQLICDCIFCGKASHLYIDKKTQLFYCQRCQEHGSIYKILKHLDKTYLLGEKSVEVKENLLSIRKILEDELTSGVEVNELPDCKMPLGFKKCKLNSYLKSRGISQADIDRYNIGETTILFRYNKYILFPIYDGGKIKGYVGRYGDKVIPDGKLRYNNSIGTDFASLIYGYDEIVKDKTETVIIVEGIFDKISVDDKLRLYEGDEVKCVCTFGKKISDIQIQKLILKGVANIILSYDYDALKEIKQYGVELDKYFNTSVAVCTDKKDLGDCNQSEVIQVFSNIKPIGEFRFDVIGKLKR